MSRSLRMPTTAAVDVARGSAVTADVLADTAYPEQSIYGNAELVRQMCEVTGQPAQTNTSGSLLDASPEEVMAWMMEGLDGFTYAAQTTAVDLDLLEVGPDIDANTLQGFCAAGMDVEAIQNATDHSSLPSTTTPADIAGELYTKQCVSDGVEVEAMQDATCVDGDRDQFFTDTIGDYKDNLNNGVVAALDNVLEKLDKQHTALKDSRELREKLLEGMLSHLSSLLQIGLGGLIGGATTRLTGLAGNAAGPYIKYMVSLLSKQLNSRIETRLLSWAQLEPSAIVSSTQLHDFFEKFKVGCTRVVLGRR